MAPIVVTIAGSDSGGGAGIQADIKTFSAFGVYGASVITAVTAQNTVGVQAIHPVPPDIISAQIDSIFNDFHVRSVKVGMLGEAPVVEAVVFGLNKHAAHAIVLDPVMIATTGRRLLSENALDALCRRLIPMALIVTPNLPEAAVLSHEPMAVDETAMHRQAQAIRRLGARAVLIKGGHGHGPESIDLLVHDGGVVRFARPRIETPDIHGTGCTLSSAIAAGLAKGKTLIDAIEEGKAYVTAAIAASSSSCFGRGAKTIHHFHRQ